MRRCDSCKTLYDNGVRICERCGTNFPYDPKVSPYSEGKMALILLIIITAVLMGYNRFIRMPITNNECSRTNYLRVQKILDDSRNRVMRIQDHGYIPLGGATTIMKERYTMDEMFLPSCFEPIRHDMVEYYTLMYKVTQISTYGGYAYTVPLLKQATEAQNRVDKTMETINKCIPNCPSPVTAGIPSDH